MDDLSSLMATEAARAVRDHAFDNLQLSHVISLIHPDNIASRRVAQKNGMIPEQETIFRGFPIIVFGMSREHWHHATTVDGEE